MWTPSCILFRYSGLLAWKSGAIDYQISFTTNYSKLANGCLDITNMNFIFDKVIMNETRVHTALCELEGQQKEGDTQVTATLLLPVANGANTTDHIATKLVRCPSDHLMHLSLACDIGSDCFATNTWEAYDKVRYHHIPKRSYCPAPVDLLPPLFQCQDNLLHVPYSLVCDYLQDCPDNSDERFCDFGSSGFTISFRCGTTKQVIINSVFLSMHQLINKCMLAILARRQEL